MHLDLMPGQVARWEWACDKPSFTVHFTVQFEAAFLPTAPTIGSGGGGGGGDGDGVEARAGGGDGPGDGDGVEAGGGDGDGAHIDGRAQAADGDGAAARKGVYVADVEGTLQLSWSSPPPSRWRAAVAYGVKAELTSVLALEHDG